jgi:hypothetical protein
MGNVQSTTIKQSLDLLQEQITNIAIQTRNSAAANCAINQNMNVFIKNAKGCPINFLQTSKTNCQLSAIFNVTNNTDFARIISQAVDQLVQTMQKAVQDFLALAVSVQMTQQELVSHIKSVLTTNLAQQTYNQCIQNATIDQNQTLHLEDIDCTTGGNINATQDAQMLALVNCVNNTVTKLLFEDQVLQKAAQSAKATQDVQQKGVSQLLTAFIGILIALVVLGVIVLLVIRGGKSKQQQEKK